MEPIQTHQYGDRLVWSQPAEAFTHRIKLGWALVTWLIAMPFILLSGFIGVLLTDWVNPNDATDAQLTLLALVFGTLITFVTVLSFRLLLIDHDRLLNSMMVAAVHVALCIVVLALGFLLPLVGVNWPIPGSFHDELGVIFTSLERSAAISIVACGLVAGTLPATGGRPAGTQTDAMPTDRQL